MDGQMVTHPTPNPHHCTKTTKNSPTRSCRYDGPRKHMEKGDGRPFEFHSSPRGYLGGTYESDDGWQAPTQQLRPGSAAVSAAVLGLLLWPSDKTTPASWSFRPTV